MNGTTDNVQVYAGRGGSFGSSGINNPALQAWLTRDTQGGFNTSNWSYLRLV
jgi:hypothetical protein